MSYPLRITNTCRSTALLSSSSSFNSLDPREFPISSPLSISRFSRRIYVHKSYGYSPIRLGSPLLLCSINADNSQSYDSSDPENSPEHQGLVEKDETRQGSFSYKETLKKLRRYGVSGVLSYGLLNTVYYLSTFLFVWLYIAPAPGKMGFSAAAQRFLKVMAMVWAGSQVTKVFRAGGALALAPFVDQGLSWFTTKFGFETRGKAFATIVGACFGLAIFLFLVVTLLWA